MNVGLESAARLNALKQGIEAKTGETYPDLTGGVNALISGYGQGGGGTVTDSALKLVETHEYTHAEDWLSDAKGNSQNVYDTYLKSLMAIHPKHLYVAYFTGGTYTGTYMPSQMFAWNFTGDGVLNNTLYLEYRGNYSNFSKSPGTGRSLWMSAGTKIIIYEYTVRGSE